MILLFVRFPFSLGLQALPLGGLGEGIVNRHSNDN
jgi:hypothetical protein